MTCPFKYALKSVCEYLKICEKRKDVKPELIGYVSLGPSLKMSWYAKLLGCGNSASSSTPSTSPGSNLLSYESEQKQGYLASTDSLNKGEVRSQASSLEKKGSNIMLIRSASKCELCR